MGKINYKLLLQMVFLLAISYMAEPELTKNNNVDLTSTESVYFYGAHVYKYEHAISIPDIEFHDFYNDTVTDIFVFLDNPEDYTYFERPDLFKHLLPSNGDNLRAPPFV